MYSDKKILEIYKSIEQTSRDWEMPMSEVLVTYINLAKTKRDQELVEVLEDILLGVSTKEKVKKDLDEEDNLEQEELQVDENEPTEEDKLQIDEEELIYEKEEPKLQEEEEKDEDYEKWTDEEKEEYYEVVKTYTNNFEFLLDKIMTEAVGGHRRISNDKYRHEFSKFIKEISLGRKSRESEETLIEKRLNLELKKKELAEPIIIKILEDRLKVIREKENGYR